MSIDFDEFSNTVAELQHLAATGSQAVNGPEGISEIVLRRGRSQRLRRRALEAGAGVLVVGVLAAASLIGHSRYFEFIQPSEGMSPTVQVGDIVTIDKSRTPQIGDVVLVSIRVNGESVKALYRYAADDLHQMVLSDRSSSTADGDFLDTFSSVSISKLPAGEVLLLGDNQRLSRDSRYFGSLPKTDIVGVAISVRTAGGPERKIPGSPTVAGASGAQVDPPEEIPPASVGK